MFLIPILLGLCSAPVPIHHGVRERGPSEEFSANKSHAFALEMPPYILLDQAERVLHTTLAALIHAEAPIDAFLPALKAALHAIPQTFAVPIQAPGFAPGITL